jgi:hypothetical protein
MKKYYVLCLCVLFAISNTLKAASVSVADAQHVAVNFFKTYAADAVGKQQINAVLFYTRTEADNTPDFYVFNIQPVTGFVVVSANDIVKPILAYSTESAFVPGFEKTGISHWMLRQAGHMAKVVSQHLAASAEVSAQWVAYRAGTAVAGSRSSYVLPLVHTSWNQEPYYNALCPYNSIDNEQAVTGCVATSMAQIMKFWNYPYQGTGSNSYDDNTRNYYSNNYGEQSANFGNTVYDWAAMPNSIQSVDTPIAILMYQCGVSVDMDYGDDNQGGSAATVLQSETWGNAPCAQSALVNNFGYDPNLIQGLLLSSSSSTSDWLNMIEAEFIAGRPIIYQGTDKQEGGHAWVADGYNDVGVHMNWGWGGQADGYYELTNLDPSGYLFGEDDGALIGIQPIRASVQTASSQINICQGDTTALKASSSPAVTYSWTPATGLSCPTCAATEAFPGTTTVYTVKVDSSGFLGTATVTVTVSPKLNASVGSFRNATCYGQPNGTITLVTSGGTPNYKYDWSNGDNAFTESNLTQGNYSVTVTDAGGCSVVVTQTIGSLPQIIVTPQSSNTTSCTSASGSATVVASGGSESGFAYLWSNGDTSSTLTDLSAGTYIVTVSDNSGCTTVTDITVGQPYQIQVTVDATNATSGNNGSVDIANVTEGIAPYTYVWSNGDTSQDASQLAPGKYTVTVTDHNGCFETASAVVSQSTAITKVNNALSFNVYPNPASGSTVIALGSLAANTTLKLDNILGQTLLTRSVTDLQTQLDLSSYASGVYLLELKQGEKRAVRQLVISR